jgi:hypothetical protein
VCGAGAVAQASRSARARRAPILRNVRARIVRAEKQLANQAFAIRAKIRFWRAPMRREVSAHENFFIAKIRDSESAQNAFACIR